MLLKLEKKLNKKGNLEALVKNLSQKLKKYMFMGWVHQTTVRKEVEREIRKFVRGLKGKYNLTLDDINNLHQNLMESVKKFGT